MGHEVNKGKLTWITSQIRGRGGLIVREGLAFSGGKWLSDILYFPHGIG